MAFCSNCGSEVTGRFCSSCGAPLEQRENVSKGEEHGAKSTIRELIALRACLSATVTQYSLARGVEQDYRMQVENIQKEIISEKNKIQTIKQNLAMKAEESKRYIAAKKTILEDA